MYRIIMLSIMALALSSCSSMKKMASSVGKQAEYKNISFYSKSSLIDKYALSEDEYNEWRNIVVSKANDLFTSNSAEPPAWVNGKQLYLRGNPLRVITIPEAEVENVELALTLNDDPKVGMLLLATDGIYVITHYSEHDPYNSEYLSDRETIFECYHFNFESLASVNSQLLGDAGRTLAEISSQYLKAKKERKEQEEKRLAEEKALLEKEKVANALSDKKQSISKRAEQVITEIKTRKINTLRLRELYLGMPATECATLLNHYLGLPSGSKGEYYKVNGEENIITTVPLIEEAEQDASEKILMNALLGMFVTDQKTENNQLARLILTCPMVDKIFNASTLTAQEFAQAIVDNYPLVKNLTGDWIQNTQCWQYTDQDRGFRITITKNKELILEKIATTSDLTF